MSTQHTPGPWDGSHPVQMTEAIGYVPVFAKNRDGGIRVICNVLISREDDQTRANLHTISAAPDMYEALKSIVENHDFCGDDWGDRRDAWIETARAAMAKAEGKS